MKSIDIADLDCIYLTYDEPQKEEFWIKIRNLVPWAKRVDGVKGSDAAHKAAAEASDTERFILVDGDNLPDARFFNLTLEFPDESWERAVFRWRARNYINGLMYGNGGLKLWTRTFVNNMRTHENSDPNDTKGLVEFCFDDRYYQFNTNYSTSVINGSPFQAFRAGFREGVKMSLNQGAKVSNIKDIWWQNYQRLLIWCSVGRDVENGDWAIYGAREGCYLTNCTDWDYANVRDFEYLTQQWKEKYSKITEEMLPYEIIGLGETLRHELSLEIADLDKRGSEFFRTVYQNTPRIIGRKL